MSAREFMRGAVTLHVLHHARRQPVTGVWMSEELARHGYEISPGTLYPLLHRMEDDGLLESERDVVGGRVLRAYRITADGLDTLGELERALRELADEVLDGRVRLPSPRAGAAPAPTRARRRPEGPARGG